MLETLAGGQAFLVLNALLGTLQLERWNMNMRRITAWTCFALACLPALANELGQYEVADYSAYSRAITLGTAVSESSVSTEEGMNLLHLFGDNGFVKTDAGIPGFTQGSDWSWMMILKRDPNENFRMFMRGWAWEDKEGDFDLRIDNETMATWNRSGGWANLNATDPIIATSNLIWLASTYTYTNHTIHLYANGKLIATHSVNPMDDSSNSNPVCINGQWAVGHGQGNIYGEGTLDVAQLILSKSCYSSNTLQQAYANRTYMTSDTNTWLDIRVKNALPDIGKEGDHYVNIANASPAWPYESWSTAATNIQEAVNAATDGDSVWVADGVYASGGTLITAAGSVTNRVVINKAIAVLSVNGPDSTFIQGAGSVGSDAIRCVYLGTNAYLSGFTVTNGASSGVCGGIFCEDSATVSNCVITGNSAYSYGGGVYQGFLVDCVITNNHLSGYGGGVAYSDLLNCTIAGNSAGARGGGAYYGKLTGCTLSANRAYQYGGGAFVSELQNCVLTRNSTYGTTGVQGGGAWACTLTDCELTYNTTDGAGGGAFGGTLTRCSLIGNRATSGFHSEGGGAHSATLNHCILLENYSGISGGGAAWSTLNNCTVSKNEADASSSSFGGGGTYFCTLKNSIIWGNSVTLGSGPNYYDFDETLTNCCTTPLPSAINGCIDTDPLFASTNDFHLTASSPCIDAGDNAYSASATDLDGQILPLDGDANTTPVVDMGCYEYFNVNGDTDGDQLTDGDEVNLGTDLQNPDSDGDQLADGAEVHTYGSNPLNVDTDGDAIEDGIEVANGGRPTVSDTWLVDYIRDHGATFDLYPSNSVVDLAIGQAAFAVSNGMAELTLQLEESTDLSSWTDAGDSVIWEIPVDLDKAFYRVRSGR